MRPPPFHHKAAVAKFVSDKMQEYWDEEERVFMTEYAPYLPPYIKIRKPSAEQSAVYAAEQGDVTALTKLIAAGAPLAPATRTLINEFLERKRSLKTGKKGGAEKKSADERRAMNPVHNAAAEFPLIRNILRAAFPTQSRADIRMRAEELAATRNGARVGTLRIHLNLPKKHPKRVK